MPNSFTDEVYLLRIQCSRQQNNLRIDWAVQSQLYSKAAKEYLEEHENERLTSKVNEIYSEEPSGLDHIAQELQYSSLTKSEW